MLNFNFSKTGFEMDFVKYNFQTVHLTELLWILTFQQVDFISLFDFVDFNF